METQPVGHGGDAADDPAIFVHPTDPARSAIIATDKKGGCWSTTWPASRCSSCPTAR
jgi:myo-inositol-hexaphosphate 3-phosphohydrolase